MLVLFTVIFFGGGTLPFLKLLKVETVKPGEEKIEEFEDTWLTHIDKKYIQKFLLRREVYESMFPSRTSIPKEEELIKDDEKSDEMVSVDLNSSSENKSKSAGIHHRLGSSLATNVNVELRVPSE